jgi:hypothetical protein
MEVPEWNPPKQPTLYDDIKSTFRSLPFQYDKLNSNHSIRVLELHPRPLDAAGADWLPTCSITQISLQEQRQRQILYTAISYTWGTRPDVSRIYINGRPLVVRNNVSAMLKWLAKTDQSRTLWIDSICINQDDVHERNNQVRLMGDIYARANYVISWLSPDEGMLPYTLTLLSRIARKASNYDLHERKDIQHLIQKFFKHAYWTRRWIIQEVLLGRSVMIATPSASDVEEIPLSFLSAFFQNYRDVKYLTRLELDAIDRSSARSLLNHRSQEVGTDRTLRDLLISYQDARCTDVRDKIFALVSLSPKASLHLRIDYTIKPVDLFFEVLAFSGKHDLLDPTGVVSLMLQLQRQLGLSRNDLEEGVKSLHSGLSSKFPQLESISAFRRGEVRSTRIEASGEAYAYRHRDAVPSLSTVDEYILYPVRPMYECAGISYTPEERKQSKRSVSGQDLVVFTYNQVDKHGNDNDWSQVGVSSCWVHSGHEVWQFLDTPVALIVEKRDTSAYQLLGRAFIYAHSSNGTYETDYQYEQPFTDLIDNAAISSHEAYALYKPQELRIDNDFDLLFDVLEWVDFDH